MLTYYITDRTQFAGAEAERGNQLLETVRNAAAAGVDFIQLREKDLPIRDLESLARQVLSVIRAAGRARLLINHRTDLALAVGADGVHLTGDDLLASDVRAMVSKSRPAGEFLIAVSCHSAPQVRLAGADGADLAVLAPIFEKVNTGEGGIGLEELRRAARRIRSLGYLPRLATPAGAFRSSPWEESMRNARRFAPRPAPLASPVSGSSSKASICLHWSARCALSSGRKASATGLSSPAARATMHPRMRAQIHAQRIRAQNAKQTIASSH